jgi:Coenzyme PQQ synthesis protein D (PqqD)
VTANVDIESFAARFVLEAFEDGGVLVDLDAGGIWRVNATASYLCEALIRGEPADRIEQAFADRFGVTVDDARRDMALLFEQVRGEPRPGQMIAEDDPYRYVRQGDRYVFTCNGEPMLEIDPSRKRARRLFGPDMGDADLANLLRATTPKMLALHGYLTLHASALRIGERVVAFVGRSKAGKSTTARAFASPERLVIADDMVVLAFDGDAPRVILDAEQACARWRERKIAPLRARGGEVDFSDLIDAVSGPRAEISRFIALDAARRRGERIRLDRLPKPDAMCALLRQSQMAAHDRTIWHEHIGRLAILARTVPVDEAVMPVGLDALDRAAGSYHLLENA